VAACALRRASALAARRRTRAKLGGRRRRQPVAGGQATKATQRRQGVPPQPDPPPGELGAPENVAAAAPQCHGTATPVRRARPGRRPRPVAWLPPATLAARGRLLRRRRRMPAAAERRQLRQRRKEDPRRQTATQRASRSASCRSRWPMVAWQPTQRRERAKHAAHVATASPPGAR